MIPVTYANTSFDCDLVTDTPDQGRTGRDPFVGTEYRYATNEVLIYDPQVEYLLDGTVNAPGDTVTATINYSYITGFAVPASSWNLHRVTSTSTETLVATGLSNGKYAEFIDSDGQDVLLGNGKLPIGVALHLNNTSNPDIIAGTATAPDLIYGNQGDDVLTGVGESDTLLGGQGADTLTAGGNWNSLYGNAGKDVIYGAASGADFLYGGRGADRIYGGDANDYIVGGFGADSMSGGRGADSFYLGMNQGADLILGFSQAQGDKLILQGTQTFSLADDSSGGTLVHLSGGGSVDLAGAALSTIDKASLTSIVYGNQGNESLSGQVVFAGPGNDTITGTNGWDLIYGDDGADLIRGDQGDDTLGGGAGADTFVYSVNYGPGGSPSFGPSDGRDSILDFNQAEGDKLQLLNTEVYAMGDDGNGGTLVSLYGGMLSGLTQVDLAGVALGSINRATLTA